MISVKELISLLEEEIKGYEEGKEYSLSVNKNTKTYQINSSELKGKLRDIFSANPEDNERNSPEAGYEVSRCEGGFCYSYNATLNFKKGIDRVTLWKKEEQAKVSDEEIEKRRREVLEKRKQGQGNFYYSETSRSSDREGNSESETWSFPIKNEPMEKSSTSQFQTPQQEAKQQEPNFLGKPRYW